MYQSEDKEWIDGGKEWGGRGGVARGLQVVIVQFLN